LIHVIILGISININWNNVVASRRDVSTNWPRLKAKSLGASISQIKSVCTKRIRATGLTDFDMQPRYYDHIIQDNKDLDRIRNYIVGNPYKWDEDEGNPANVERN